MRLPNQEFRQWAFPVLAPHCGRTGQTRCHCAAGRCHLFGILLSNDIFNNHGQLDTKDDKPYRNLRGNTLEGYQPIALHGSCFSNRAIYLDWF